MVCFPCLDGEVPRSASCGVCDSQLIRFAGVSGCEAGFGARGKNLAAELLMQGSSCHGFRWTFSEFVADALS